ncbi:hypothetical protein ID866_9375 [Astraeus odoratus]|nr:hypothetical protein ID866_9375 [Astraeus odoratus]
MSLDPTRALDKLRVVERSSRYCLNLDGRVDRGDNFVVRGGYALVRKGKLRPEGTEIAIKTSRGGLPGDELTIKRFLKEVHLWSKLKHNNILPLLGITTEFDMTVSIISLWMDKGNAHDYVQDASVDPRPLIHGIARGLHYLHNYQPNAVIHGDLQGVNVLISANDQALLTDFGLSLLANSSFSLSTPHSSGGTMNWMAPEIFDGEEVTFASDVWEFGMTSLELFTRTNPFHHIRGGVQIMMRILNGPPDRPSVEDTSSRLTDQWWNVLTLCWERESNQRPKMSQFTEALNHLVCCLVVTRRLIIC